MKQQTLSGFERYGKTTRRAQYLVEMDRLAPWAELGEAIEPIYPKGGGEAGSRPPVSLQRMLRIYFLQLWFNLSGPAVEEALYDSASMRGFVGIDLGSERVPDETTVCKFRHLLERNGMGVEHTIGVIKRVFEFQKVRYRGLAKSLHRLEVTAALVLLPLPRDGGL